MACTQLTEKKKKFLTISCTVSNPNPPTASIVLGVTDLNFLFLFAISTSPPDRWSMIVGQEEPSFPQIRLAYYPDIPENFEPLSLTPRFPSRYKLFLDKGQEYDGWFPSISFLAIQQTVG